VTQDNRGKKTAGVDGVKSLAPAARVSLAVTRRPTPTGRAVRRVWIPKPGKAEQRPLGIPTMRDRAAQTLVRLALEPEWEAHFEPNSFGFRPGRSAHDAIEAIFVAIHTKAKFVLDADIAACFDRIDHAALLQKLHTFPCLRRTIRGWLKAGVLDGKELFPSDAGTPQGGPLSPLLANIALHGLETAVRTAFPVKRMDNKRWTWIGQPSVIRYADDFVILHHDLAVVEQARHITEHWLAGVGLELKPAKTRVSHTLLPHEGHVGFDFLGFEVRQHRIGYHRSGRLRLGFKTIIRPSKDAQKRHLAAMARIIRAQRTVPQPALISHLNPLILGWARYNSRCVAKATFARMDHLVYAKLQRWSRRRHSGKGRAWVANRYWRPLGGQKWVFRTKDGSKLAAHASTTILRHVQVRGNKSPFDGDWAYWASRLGRHPLLSNREATLLKRQQGRCARCGLFFRDGDLLEVDHITPKHLGGIDAYFNWQLLHGHCHDAKTAADRTAGG
jgi:RNA-directed DNA polymerase